VSQGCKRHCSNTKSLYSCQCHTKRKNERLPEYNVLFLFSKLLALTIAYEIALEEHSGQCSWKDCCTKAADQMKQCGLTAFSPLTIMKWNRSFRMTETFPHPFECQKQSKPIIFRVYPGAETIARHGIKKLLKREALCCETATAFFGGEFIDRVLAKEYEDDWLEIPEDTKEIARQDLLLECRLKSKHCTSTASNWLAYLGFKYGPFFPLYYTDGHERPEQRNTESSMQSISVTKRFASTSGCS
jgi:hypothetical protein